MFIPLSPVCIVTVSVLESWIEFGPKQGWVSYVSDNPFHEFYNLIIWGRGSILNVEEGIDPDLEFSPEIQWSYKT